MKKTILPLIALIISLNLNAQGDDHKSGDSNDYCVQSDGNKIYIIYQGVTVMTDIVLDNGTTVKPDGTIITKDKNTTLLKIGQCINRDGTISTSINKLERQ
jgi:uncharacterized protein DUF6799